jgi:hypothetical protein
MFSGSLSCVFVVVEKERKVQGKKDMEDRTPSRKKDMEDSTIF